MRIQQGSQKLPTHYMLNKTITRLIVKRIFTHSEEQSKKDVTLEVKVARIS